MCRIGFTAAERQLDRGDLIPMAGKNTRNLVEEPIEQQFLAGREVTGLA